MAHHIESPSNYSAWAECLCYDGAERDNAQASEGTSAHDEVSKCLKDPNYVADNSVSQWGADTITNLANGNEIHSEEQVTGTVEDVKGVYGTPDAYWREPDGTLCIADFKTFSDGTTNHMPQLEGYAALLMREDWDANLKVKLYILHGGVRQVEAYQTTVFDCYDNTRQILRDKRSGNAKPCLCKWCQFCKHIKECQSTNYAVDQVSEQALTFSKLSICQKLVVLDAVDKISKAIRDDAKKMAESNGGAIEMDGIKYELKPWAGKSKVRDLCEVASTVASPVYLKVNEKKQEAEEVKWNGLSNSDLLKLCDLPKTALANALIEKNPKAVKSDVKKYVEQFYDKTEGAPHFVRTK